MEVKSVQKDGRIASEKFGKTGGVKQSRYVNAADVKDLKAVAENEYNLFAYDGYEGSFTGWLVPYVAPAWQVEIRDADRPEKNGVYYVTGTETNFSSAGGNRKVTLGRRIK